eukprot:COSAG02_NODE_8986_length_2372_cov_1.330840_1_plen_136_part_10
MGKSKLNGIAVQRKQDRQKERDAANQKRKEARDVQKGKGKLRAQWGCFWHIFCVVAVWCWVYYMIVTAPKTLPDAELRAMDRRLVNLWQRCLDPCNHQRALYTGLYPESEEKQIIEVCEKIKARTVCDVSKVVELL